MKRFAVTACALAGLLLGGCASLPIGLSAPSAQPAPEQPAASAPPDRDPTNAAAATPSASAELLRQSRDERAAGDLSAAARSLDQALRIDPDDPELWLEYAELKHAQGDDEQARVMAHKAIALAGDDAALTSRASQLLR